MVGAFPPVIKKYYSGYDKYEPDDYYFLMSELDRCASELLELKISKIELESRIRELEAQLETLSPGVTRG